MKFMVELLCYTCTSVQLSITLGWKYTPIKEYTILNFTASLASIIAYITVDYEVILM